MLEPTIIHSLKSIEGITSTGNFTEQEQDVFNGNVKLTNPNRMMIRMTATL